MHAYSSILPAVLAVDEAEGQRGRDLLTAVTVAADAQCRLALAYPLQLEEVASLTKLVSLLV
jgi:2-methylcitrate dehydratase PrpD